MKRYIYVTFDKEGIHEYPAALENPRLEDVKFLGYPHRHKFCYKVTLEVFHDDRDIEFILFKRELQGLFQSGAMDIDYKSCEMLEHAIGIYISDKYPVRDMIIDVSEDNENGAILEIKA